MPLPEFCSRHERKRHSVFLFVHFCSFQGTLSLLSLSFSLLETTDKRTEPVYTRANARHYTHTYTRATSWGEGLREGKTASAWVLSERRQKKTKTKRNWRKQRAGQEQERADQEDEENKATEKKKEGDDIQYVFKSDSSIFNAVTLSRNYLFPALLLILALRCLFGLLERGRYWARVCRLVGDCCLRRCLARLPLCPRSWRTSNSARG